MRRARARSEIDMSFAASVDHWPVSAAVSLNLRYRPEKGKPLFCHTLNNTVAASPRILIPLLENHQNADGTVNVPERLRPYLGGREVLGKPVF